MGVLYDRIGKDYSAMRCTDPTIATQLHVMLQDASRIINIGAGSGSYEPENADLIAVEPSSRMIAQRAKSAYPAVQASAESLPFDDNSFSHAMTVLSMHHWTDRATAFKEINRVTTDKFVAVTWNPNAPPFWLTRDYFPEIYETDLSIFPDINELNQHFDHVQVTPLCIPKDCKDGFLAAFWQKPEAYLSEKVRQSISSFSKINQLPEGLAKLEYDITSGVWEDNQKDILSLSSLDVGYVLIVADVMPG